MIKKEIWRLEIVVVVDGSTDGTLEMLGTDFREVHVVEGNGSWWYTKCMNEGFRMAEKLNPEIVLMLNDDIVLCPDYMSEIMNAYYIKGPDCIIGSVSFTVTEPHRVTNSGVKRWNRFLDKTESYFPFLSEVEPSTISGIHPTPVLPGRGMLVSWSILKKLNYFDENFAQYQSDFDFTLRALRFGFPIYISWDARVFSYIEKTGAGSSFLKSSWKTIFKNFTNPHSRTYIPNRSLYYWRHYYKLLWPWYMIKFIMLSIRNYVVKTKLS